MEGTSSIKLTQRDDLSLLYRVMRKLMRSFRPKLAGMPKTPFPEGSPKLDPPSLNVTVKQRRVDDIYLYDLIPRNGKRSTSHRIYYFSGGGFQQKPSKDHWKLCAAIATQLSATHEVTVVSYPLAPKSPAAKTLPMLQTLLRTLCKDAAEDHKSIVVAGDSSGGNIAICLGFWWARELTAAHPLPTPLSVFAMAPVVDLTNSNPEIRQVDKFEPLLTIDMTESVAVKWAGSLPRDSPEISPLFEDFNVLRSAGVRVHGLVGTYDLLAPDDAKFYKALGEHSVEGEWLEWKGQMHCFPLAFSYGIRECKEGKDWIIGMLKRDAMPRNITG